MFIPQNFKDKKCLIIGGGKSGIEAAKLILKKITKNIIISDKNKINTSFHYINESKINNKIIKEIDFAIKSPGILPQNKIIKLIKKYRKPIFSEVELALSLSKTQNTIMITGTNGKSTTTYLTYLILDSYLKKKSTKAILCGNIGYPISSKVLSAKQNDWLVIEISSYQIEDSTFIKPKIASILNITPDHIEHHGSMENYIKAKFKIFSYMDKSSTLILNGDDPTLNKIKDKPFNIIRFSIKKRNLDAFYEKGKIFVKNLKKPFIPSQIPGIHNIQNQMAAILISLSCGVDYETIQEVLLSFKGLEHRIEFVKEINGVKYYNDSKATNVDSTIVSLKALGREKNIILILGGIHKGAPYTPLIPLIKKYVKKIITIGSAAKLIEKDLSSVIDIKNCSNIKNAVKYVSNISKPGDIVLLSPACASFDQFKNFEERGKIFKRLVNSL
ncbi:MAG: UDP-N-acetylmuramoyl-L-alanine--D-glutamate ligase [Elusimicrobiales bacterium]|nr:UDP-N-acetylmuramoyl-L-alanine--D-glutamate ligase [Elusimicrobiales bacterium]